MKKFMSIGVAFLSILFITALIINPVYARTAKGGNYWGKAIPESVMKIAQKSCVKCHAEPGNGMALSMVNLTKWDRTTPEKQAAKAKSMCSMVTKDKMPPKKFRESNPDGVPSKEEIAIICDWATSLQVVKK